MQGKMRALVLGVVSALILLVFTGCSFSKFKLVDSEGSSGGLASPEGQKGEEPSGT